MRSLIGFGMVLLLCGLATGQAPAGPGHSQLAPPGVYAAPFVPLVNTPSVSADRVPTPTISLDPVSLKIGTSSATAGNVAGAARTTLSIDTTGSRAEFARPMWYGPAAYQEEPVEVESAPEVLREGNGFEFGGAMFQSSYGVAQLMTGSHPTKPARVYTNKDIARINDSNGFVRPNGKMARAN